MSKILNRDGTSKIFWKRQVQGSICAVKKNFSSRKK